MNRPRCIWLRVVVPYKVCPYRRRSRRLALAARSGASERRSRIEFGEIQNMAEQKLKVYLETSFVSYLTGGETDNARIASEQAYSRQWWSQERPKCDVFASVYTSAESEKGNSRMVDRRKRILEDVPQLDFDEDKVIDLAQKLLDGHALPTGEGTDALHIAVAAVTGMDVVLSWNCKHIANPHTLPKTRAIITKAGFPCPQVMTPKTFLENLNMEA